LGTSLDHSFGRVRAQNALKRDTTPPSEDPTPRSSTPLNQRECEVGRSFARKGHQARNWALERGVEHAPEVQIPFKTGISLSERPIGRSSQLSPSLPVPLSLSFSPSISLTLSSQLSRSLPLPLPVSLSLYLLLLSCPDFPDCVLCYRLHSGHVCLSVCVSGV
jgi:hypothetical protein